MPGFCNSYRVGDSIHVDEGGGISIEFIVKNIGGTRRRRTAEIYIEENGIVTNHKELRYDRIDDKALVDGIFAKIPNDSKSGSGRVMISFSYLKDYAVTRGSKRDINELVFEEVYSRARAKHVVGEVTYGRIGK
jgi:hypothetical protein